MVTSGMASYLGRQYRTVHGTHTKYYVDTTPSTKRDASVAITVGWYYVAVLPRSSRVERQMIQAPPSVQCR